MSDALPLIHQSRTAPIIKARGGNRWTVAYWPWPRFNFYVRLGSRSVFWRQP